MKQKLIIFIAAACLSFGYLYWSNASDRLIDAGQVYDANQVTKDLSDNAKTVANNGSGDSVPDQPSRADPVESSHNPVLPKAGSLVERGDRQYPVRIYRPVALPNDPLVDESWPTRTKVSEVWNTTRPAVETTLAVIDSGFALQHEEFRDRWALNPGETGTASTESGSIYNCTDRGLPMDMSCNLIDDDRDGVLDNESGPAVYENPSRLNCTDQGKSSITKDCNMIDDDGNGLVDDHTGWDFMSFDNSVQAGELNPNGDGTTHGTMVAGLAAATGNNGVGIAGVDWATKILPLQALDDDSYGDTFSVGDAIYYAVERDVDVISLSLGSAESDEYVRGAVRAAVAAGITVVAASGNDGCDCIVYPARYPEVLAVGALDESDNPAYFSSWGSSLDIMAPGVNLRSTTWQPANTEQAYVQGINGTSFATPIVAGMLTRILASQPAANPQQLVAALTENTNRTMLTQTVARDNSWGFGRLDAASAHRRMITASVEPTVYAFTPAYNGNYLSATTLEADPDQVIYRCSGNRPGSTPLYNLTKTGNDFFTISDSEQQSAVAQGYASQLLAYGCLQQPHDAPTTVRKINIFREFKNIQNHR